jgi:hypothetical protein
VRRDDGEHKLLLAAFGPCLRGTPSQTLAEWWEQQVTLFERLGLQITHISGKFREKPKRLSDHTAYTYTRYQRRFEIELSRGNLAWLDLEAMNTKPHGYVAFDWDAVCGLNDDQKRGASAETGIDLRHLDRLDQSVMGFLKASILETTSSFIDTTYGYCTVMPRSFMPAGYAIGIMASKAPDMLIRDANIWSDSVRRECYRYLRNVFAINVLGRSHLDLKVGEQRLEDWVSSGPSRGTLSELGDNLIVWSLMGADEGWESLRWDAPAVTAVREELMRHKLFPWQSIDR